jgi:outer membrane protein OmpA-like peptidoglycan-associated protein
MHDSTPGRMPCLFGVVTGLIWVGTAWGDDLRAPRRPPTAASAREARWGPGEPRRARRPRPSLFGTTGYCDLPTSASLRQGHVAVGLFPMCEQVFTADLGAGDDFTRRRLDRYRTTLSGAYGILANLELGVAMRGVHTDAEVKECLGGDERSDDVHETGFGKMRVGLKYRPAALGVVHLRTIGFAGLALEPLVEIQTHGTERGRSYPYRDQDPVYGLNLLMGGQAGPIGMHWRLGDSRTEGRNVDHVLVLGSPLNVEARGLSDGERIGYTLAVTFQPRPALNVMLKGDGDTRARHPWDTREDHRVNALAGAISTLPHGLAVHAGWQVDLHDPMQDRRGHDLDYRIMTGGRYALARPVAAPPPLQAPPPQAPPPPPQAPPPPERRVERMVRQPVHFAFDQSRLTPLGRRVLDEAAEPLKDHPHLRVEIEGPTDATGTERYNLGLGQRRAEGVKGDLVLRHQLDPKRMTALSYGEARPIADHRPEEGRALNRRVEFTVVIR